MGVANRVAQKQQRTTSVSQCDFIIGSSAKSNWVSRGSAHDWLYTSGPLVRSYISVDLGVSFANLMVADRANTLPYEKAKRRRDAASPRWKRFELPWRRHGFFACDTCHSG